MTGSGAQLPDDFDSPARQLQSRLGMVLGEHAELAVDAMRAGISTPRLLRRRGGGLMQTPASSPP